MSHGVLKNSRVTGDLRCHDALVTSLMNAINSSVYRQDVQLSCYLVLPSADSKTR